MAQAAEYDYGTPGDRVVRADYRVVGAFDRLISRAGASAASEFLLGRRSAAQRISGQDPFPLAVDDNGKIIRPGYLTDDPKYRAAYERWRATYEHVKDVVDWNFNPKKSGQVNL